MPDPLIAHLAATLTPVRPRRASRELAALGLLALAEAGLLFWLGIARHDFGFRLAALESWKIVASACVAVAATWIAVRGGDPGRTRVGAGAIGAVALIALTVGVGMAHLSPATLSEGLRPVDGLLCVLAATIFACPPAIALGLFLRRAAPARPREAAFAAAVAAGATGATLLALHCPDDHAIHSLLWHSVAVVVPALVAMWPITRAAKW
jgi:hypothetical protein